MKKLLIIMLAVLCASNSVFGNRGVKIEEKGKNKAFKPGFLNITELHAGFGLGNTDRDLARNFAGITTVLGYGITKNFQGGIGSGISFYNGGTLVPVFLDLRFIISLGKMSAFAFGDGGLLLNVSGPDNETRFLLNPGIGIAYPIGNKLSANIGAGLFSQTTSDKTRDTFINLKLGITCRFGK